MPPTVPPTVQGLHHAASGTVSYLVADPGSGRAAIIDPVLDFDVRSGRTGTQSADRLADLVRTAGWTVDWILDTHVHADHLSAAADLQAKLGGRMAIGAEIGIVQRTFRAVFDLASDDPADGAGFDHLFADGETFALGTLAARVLHTPGHTPACVSYLIGDAAFVGDTLFMPDSGTARCDFPGGDAARLYRSIRRLLDLPPQTRIFVGHDYAQGRPAAWATTVAAERAGNIHVRDGIDEAAFVALRRERDAGLELPQLIIPAVQVNIRGGRMPAPAANGVAYLKLPVDGFPAGAPPAGAPPTGAPKSTA